MERPDTRSVLPATVIALGAVSLLTDASSEMIFSLLPAFIAARFAAAPLILGAMEGLADLVASGFKYASGRWADRARWLRPFVFGGYGLSALMRPLMGFAVRWWQPLVIRAADRIGKGIRTSPRDVMIAQWVPEGGRGRAFSFHQGMDHAGAALGAALALALTWLGMRPERVFFASAVPGALAVAAILFVREPPRVSERLGKQSSSARVPGRVWAYLVPVALFGLSNSTDAFLLLKLTEQGARPALLPLAWLLLHVVKAAASYPAGWTADRLGPSRIVLAGWVLYATSYLGLAASTGIAFTLGTIAFYGLYHALSEGAEKALLVSLVAPEARGHALGLYHGLSGVSSLVAGLLFGALWRWEGSGVAFVVAGATAAASAVLLAVLLPRAKGRPATV